MTDEDRKICFELIDGDPQVLTCVKGLSIFNEFPYLIRHLKKRGLRGRAILSYFHEAGGTPFQMATRIQRERRGLMWRPFLLPDMVKAH